MLFWQDDVSMYEIQGNLQLYYKHTPAHCFDKYQRW